ncbi:NAD(P)/FAD-dependent oxidoreductase [Micrococcus endophyticus]|nr:NAD(P)/FAD-dependent oxidoreductase [Micrococcus endophyticus]MCK6091787.1 NAD(P)/FAD-dependent oxidoreductase [Micrococcus endophyticus]
MPAGGEPGRAVVVGAGPNGLTAAALLARAGWEVDVHERHTSPGGACASAPLLGEGTVVDLGAAGHPFGVASPVFADLDLTGHGLRWAHPEVVMAHPLPDGEPGLLYRDLERTAAGLDADSARWWAVHAPLVEGAEQLVDNVLGPIVRPWPHPLTMTRFGLRAPWPASWLTGGLFRTEQARALFVGSAVHAVMAPSRPFTAAFGALFAALGMSSGWPVAEGGSQTIVDALIRVLRTHGGRLHLGSPVEDLRAFADVDAVLLDLTPTQVARLRGTDLPKDSLSRMRRWRHGSAAFKVDMLLDGPIPWADPRVGQAGTVHLGGTAAQVQRAEADVAAGRMPDEPFVMLCQQQSADPSRAVGPAAGRHVVWSYAHVPHGHSGDATHAVLARIERFAPGLRDRIVRIVATSPAELEAWNPNLVGGDIAGGAMDGLQLLARPRVSAAPHRLRAAAPSAWRTSSGRTAPGLYLASASTSPGAGVHGMAGAWAVRTLLSDRRGAR